MMTYIDNLYIVHDEFLVLPYLDVSYITKKKLQTFENTKRDVIRNTHKHVITVYRSNHDFLLSFHSISSIC